MGVMAKTRDRLAALVPGIDPDDAESPRFQLFIRGLSIGALVGAAIAGSAIWERGQRRRASSGSEDSLVPDQSAAGDGTLGVVVDD
jgi:hypothetical protein